MHSQLETTLQLFALAGALYGCGGGYEYPDRPPNPNPQPYPQPAEAAIRIVSPVAGEVTLGADPLRTVPIEVALPDGFTTAAPGACPGGATNNQCGHVHIQLDNSALEADGRCPDKPYNSVITSGVKGEARFACLRRPAGAHIISVELHRDDHSEFAGPAARARVAVTAKPAATAFPLAIAAPTMESTTIPVANPNLTVELTPMLTNFRLAAPGTCAGDPDCGHMHLTIDPHLGDAYNCDGNPYNNSGAGPKINAWFRCVPEEKRSGPHIIGVTLHRDDHQPYLMTPQLKPAGAWVRVNLP